MIKFAVVGAIAGGVIGVVANSGDKKLFYGSLAAFGGALIGMYLDNQAQKALAKKSFTQS